MQKLLEQIADNIGIVAAGIAVVWLLVGVTDEVLPEHNPQPRTCSCAYKTDCEIAVFMVTDGRRAYCAISADGTNCCTVDAKRDE